jgi:NADPH:quinone reductase
MARTARIETVGGPEVIGFVDVDLPPPGPGEVRMANAAVGLNFIDTYHRSGLYKIDLPSGLGKEAAGTVEAVGEGVTGFAPGDRVATFDGVIGAYASARNVPAASLVHLPDSVDFETAAAALLKGLTTEFLVERAAKVQPGWTVLVHAAAGGVGQILVQWLKAAEATVIGTVGSEAKVEAARAAGADHILLSRRDDIAAKVREITGGAGVPAVFDGVGAATWQASLASCARRGLVLSYGNASGPVQGVNLATLNDHGSLFVTRPKMNDYYVDPAEREAGAARLFAMLESGKVRAGIGRRFALEQAAEAHRVLEAGETMGSTLLVP